ncbi:hypothetical protein KIW84_064370 [Lathyrus oleraceus]|uniref:Uncharacterized protein n=1 Tax=Pisum sativum TaxID=3888 RepID=A0A9D4WCJ2_PEA|nr:hypothetical protein KIW84_064370 [Pisum sativum]
MEQNSLPHNESLRKPNSIPQKVNEVNGGLAPLMPAVDWKIKPPSDKKVTWQWLPFKHSARKDDLQLSHWPLLLQQVKVVNGVPPSGDYSFAKYNMSVDITRYTDEEYEKYLANPVVSRAILIARNPSSRDGAVDPLVKDNDIKGGLAPLMPAVDWKIKPPSDKKVTWQWLPFKHSARKDDLQLSHWIHENLNSAAFSMMQILREWERAKESTWHGNQNVDKWVFAKILMKTCYEQKRLDVSSHAFERMDLHGSIMIVFPGHVNDPKMATLHLIRTLRPH